MNNTRVLPARLFESKKKPNKYRTSTAIKKIRFNYMGSYGKTGQTLKVGSVIFFHETLSAVVKEIKEEGIRIVEFLYDGLSRRNIRMYLEPCHFLYSQKIGR